MGSPRFAILAPFPAGRSSSRHAGWGTSFMELSLSISEEAAPEGTADFLHLPHRAADPFQEVERLKARDHDRVVADGDLQQVGEADVLHHTAPVMTASPTRFPS